MFVFWWGGVKNVMVKYGALGLVWNVIGKGMGSEVAFYPELYRHSIAIQYGAKTVLRLQ